LHLMLFVGEHLPVFHFVHRPFQRIGFGKRMPAPDFAFYVVLKENARNCQLLGKIYRRVEEVADRNINSSGVKRMFDELAYRRTGKPTDGIWSFLRHMPEIINSPSNCATPSLPCANRH